MANIIHRYININKLIRLSRTVRNFPKKIRNKNHTFTILCDSCVAGVIYRELNEVFRTPTINVGMEGKSFILFLKNIDFYLSQEIVEVEESGLNYPVGKLFDIYLNFVHSHSFQEAKQIWDKRKQRINFSNLYVLMTENDGCNYSVMKDFEALPYKNKIILTHKPYPEIKSSFYVKGFESATEIGNVINYSNKLGRRYYDDFDWVKWLNE